MKQTIKTFRLPLMLLAAAAVIVAPAFAEGKMKHHHKVVSSTTVEGMGAATAPGPGATYDSTPNVERTPDGMNNKTDEQKVNGVGANPNTKDPSAAPK